MLATMLDAQAAIDILLAGSAGDAWYGSSTADVLEGLDAESASTRVDCCSHSIWEILLHAAGWMEEVARRLEGRSPSPPADGDWPAVGDVSDLAWESAKLRFQVATWELGKRLKTLDPGKWTQMVGENRVQSLGTGVTYAEMVVGVIQHNAYHTGQMALVRKAIGK